MSEETFGHGMTSRGAQMETFQKRFPHLNWPWYRRRWFLLRYDVGMAVSYLRTRWFVWKRG